MKDFLKVYNDRNTYPHIRDIANALGISERTVRRWAKNERERGEELIDRSTPPVNESQKRVSSDVESGNVKTQVLINRLNERLRDTQRQLRDAHKELTSSQEIIDFIHEVKGEGFNNIPNWLSHNKRSINDLTGIPVLFLSDIHFDEVVESSQVSGVNVYNRAIAEQRIEHTFDKAISLLTDYMKDTRYDGFVLALGGDLLSGNIHDELAETNEYPILKSVIRLTELLIAGITRIHEQFGRVFVPCVVGNHGRIHQNKRTKNKIFENYEWVIYQMLAKHFKGNKDITFHIPDSIDSQFKIYNTRFLLEHGDSFRGGSGIAGIFSPLMLGIHKKNKNKSAINKPFDVMMIGHFHQYIHTSNLIVNGSIKGYDTYAYNNNFPFEKPQQALFIVHPKYGITFRLPVQCEVDVDHDMNDSPKLTVFE